MTYQIVPTDPDRFAQEFRGTPFYNPAYKHPTVVSPRQMFGSSGKWGGGDVVGTFRIPNLLPVRLSI